MKSARFATALIVGALALHWLLQLAWLRSAYVTADARYLYLPGAARLLEAGWKFFLEPLSVQAPPVAFLWPAAFGADPARVQLANYLLSGATLLLAARAAWLMHSPLAGAAAALLVALSPLLRPWFTQPLTEAPFLFFSAAWWWGLCEFVHRGRRAALVAAVLALALAGLTRATFFAWMPVVVAFFAVLAWRGASDGRERARRIAIAHAAAMLLPVAFMAKNLAAFDFPFFATGGGAALYQGNNPLTGGYDANYVEIAHDVGAIARDQSHLTLEAERLLRGTARLMISEQPWDARFRLHAKKLAAFFLVTSAEPHARTLRGWRIALLVFGVAGLLAMRDPRMRALFAALVACQVAVHVPVVYTYRYSVGALDLWLVIAAGIGMAALFRRGRIVAAAAALALVAAGLVASAYVLRVADPPAPDVLAAPRMRVVESSVPPRADAGSGVVEVELPASERFFAFNNHVVVLDVDAEPGCSRLTVSYRPAASDAFHAAAPRRLHAGPNRIQVGWVPLALSLPGRLRLAPECAAPARIAVRRVAVYAAIGSIDWRERLLGEKPLFPVER